MYHIYTSALNPKITTLGGQLQGVIVVFGTMGRSWLLKNGLAQAHLRACHWSLSSKPQGVT